MQIRKGNVDRFSGGQMIPRCELLLQWPHPDKPHVCLLHKIDLIGANGCTFFTLYIPPAGEYIHSPVEALSAINLLAYVTTYSIRITRKLTF